MLNKRLIVLGTILACASLNGMNGKRARDEAAINDEANRAVRQAREAEARMQVLAADFIIEQVFDAANADARFTEAQIQTLVTPGLTGPQRARIRDTVTNNFLDAQDRRIRAHILDH